MKTLLSLSIAILLTCSAAAQYDFSRADSIGTHFKEKYLNEADLARKLTESLNTDAEKARVLFVWVANNVRYDVDKYKNPPPKERFSAKSEKEMQQKKQEWQEEEVRSTLKSKKGVCQDYSMLYKSMCKAVGLECEVVVGDARDFFKPYRAIHDNPHAWNAVKIDGQWKLLDVTWGAGYVKNGRFSRRLGTGYFFTPPAWFAQRHLPDDPDWQLLETPLDKKDFPTLPLVNYGQAVYPLLDFSQKLERPADGFGRVQFKFEKTPKAFMVTGGQSRKPIQFKQTEEDGWVVLRFSTKGVGDIAVYMGEAVDERMEWLGKYDIK